MTIRTSRREFLAGMAVAAWSTGAKAAPGSQAAGAKAIPAPGRSVETIAALRALAAQLPAAIRVEGYFRVGDGGGGDFDFAARDNTPDNGFDRIRAGQGPAGCWQRRFDSARIAAVSAGVSPQSPQATNTAGLAAIRDRMRSEDRAWILDLPAGQINIESSRWLHGVRRVTVNGGPTRIRNNLTPGPGKKVGTTECIGLTVNPDIFLDDMGGAVASYGTFVAGNRILTAAKGGQAVMLAAPGERAAFRPGSSVLVYGYNQSSEGYPPNIRYFDYASVESLGSDPAEIRLSAPLSSDYSADWRDIAVSYETPVGAARILSLDRPGFCLAESVELNDLEFVAGSSYVEGISKRSLGGSLYAPGCRKVVLNRVRVDGYFYPTTSQRCEVNDCEISFCEMDKVVEDLIFTNCRFGEVGNGPGIQRILFDQCRFDRPFRTLNARNIEFRDCAFASADPKARILVAVAASCTVHSIRFIRPRLDVDPAQGMSLMSGGGLFKCQLLDVIDGDLILPFTGMNDEALRALDIGSVLRGVTQPTTCRVMAIRGEGQNATRLKVQTTGQPPQKGDAFEANRLWSVEIEDPVLSSAVAPQAALMSARAGPGKPFKLVNSLRADTVLIPKAPGFVSE